MTSPSGDYANGISGINQIFLGPNDCTALFTPQSDIRTAAGVLRSVLSIANSFAQAHNPNQTFMAVVDAEGYLAPLCDAASASSAQFPNADAFFSDYHVPGGPWIGPAGGAYGIYSIAQEQALATDGGGGYAIPQAYAMPDIVTTPTPYLTPVWPATMVPGFNAIQTDPTYLAVPTAEWGWYKNHGRQHPPVDFAWCTVTSC